MSRFIRLSFFASVAVTFLPAAQAQDDQELLSDMLRANPGEERIGKLVDLAASARRSGQFAQAKEYAIQGSSEAAHLGLDAELGRAQLELSMAQSATGDMENALRSAIRAARLVDEGSPIDRFDAFVQLSRIYLDEGYPQKALEYLVEAGPANAGDRSRRITRLRLEATANARALGPAAAMRYFENAYKDAADLEDQDLLYDVRMLMATTAAQANANVRAIELEHLVMDHAMVIKDTVQAGISANNLGELLTREGRMDEALGMYQRALSLLNNAPAMRIDALVNASQAYSRAGQEIAAAGLVDEALSIAHDHELRMVGPRLLRTRASLYLKNGDLPAAFAEATQALDAADTLRNEPEMAAACELLALVVERQGRSSEARTYAKRARDHAQNVQDRKADEQQDRAAELLRLQRLEREQIESLTRDEQKEFEIRQMALDGENKEKQLAILRYEKDLEEAARREEASGREQAQQALALAQATLETERQQRMIKDLDHTRVMQDLNVGRLQMEQKEREQAVEILERKNEVMEAQSRVQQATREREHMVKLYSIASALAALMVALYMTWAWLAARRKKRTIWHQNQRIQHINDQLAEKNNSIQSSINYARTIQSAILPTEETFKQALPDSFLFYRPLDKVSGDLPFVRREGNVLFVAAIDCTGHGVPAAMMTFIAYYGLNELITKHPDASCGRLLDMLHEHVKSTMESRDQGSLYNDGMDIGLCRIDLDKGTLAFAGAQLPLILVRDGKVQRIKGDLLPLGDGQFIRQQGYRNHALSLAPQDSIYLLSDGLIHQFGGADGTQKFSQRKLLALLTASAQEDLHEVKTRTMTMFDEWKGNTPQTDDVMMIGIRYAA